MYVCNEYDQSNINLCDGSEASENILRGVISSLEVIEAIFHTFFQARPCTLRA